MVLPGEVPGCVPRDRRLVADDRARFTEVLPGKLFGPKPTVMDRFPVTGVEGMPNSELTAPKVRYGNPDHRENSTNKKIKIRTTDMSI